MKEIEGMRFTEYVLIRNTQSKERKNSMANEVDKELDKIVEEIFDIGCSCGGGYEGEDIEYRNDVNVNDIDTAMIKLNQWAKGKALKCLLSAMQPHQGHISSFTTTPNDMFTENINKEFGGGE